MSNRCAPWRRSGPSPICSRTRPPRSRKRGVAKIQQQFQKALMVESAFVEVQELITETAAAPEPNPGRRQALFERECRLEDVSFAHVDAPVLRGVSLVVPAGQV